MGVRTNRLDIISGSVGELGGVTSSQRVAAVRIDSADHNSFMISSSRGGEFIYFSGSGKTGIGTTDPKSKFEVTGSIKGDTISTKPSGS